MDDDASKTEKKKRFRSPPYPAFDLERAVERVTLLDKVAQHHEVGVTALTEAWSMKSAEGLVWRSAAALIQYGLLSDSGTGKSRKFKITDSGRRIARDPDQNSQKRREAIKAAALAPMIHKTLWDRFGAADALSNTVIKGYLTLDRLDEGEAPYSDGAADEVISSYRQSLDFAGLTDSDSIQGVGSDDPNTKPDDDAAPSNTGAIKVGDHVKWTSDGVDQFASKKVDWISDDRQYLRVFGSPTGISMSEVQIAEPPGGKSQEARSAVGGPKQDVDLGEKSKGGKMALNATGYVVDGRLQLTADVTADEIDALKEMLSKYQDILRMLN